MSTAHQQHKPQTSVSCGTVRPLTNSPKALGPRRAAQCFNCSCSPMSGLQVAWELPGHVFGPPEGVLFLFTSCVCTHNTKNFVENSKMGEKQIFFFDP